MQIQFNTGVCRLILVKVPEDAHNFEVKITNETKPNQLYYLINDNIYITNQRLEILPNGNWQFIGLSHELTEDQCKPLVPDPVIISEVDNGLQIDEQYGFIDYENEDRAIETAKESFDSLLRHLKIKDDNEIFAVLRLEE